MTAPHRKLAVLAGKGRLPSAVLRTAAGSGRPVFVLAFEGETDPELVTGYDHAWVKLGAVGRAIDLLHAAAVDDVVLIGAIDRPSFGDLKLDFRGMQLLAKLGLKAARGDGHLLSTVMGELEGEGFGVIGADEIVRPLLAPLGPITASPPDDDAKRDIALGCRMALEIGRLDIGQAVVVRDGRVLAVEAIEGTDGLLARVAAFAYATPGGVLVKVKKPGQDRRADLPAVGESTVAAAIVAGLQGIAVHAGHCLLVDRSAMTAKADRAGLFITGIATDD